MGIIVLTVAIFPLLGIGGVELFVAEAPGPTSDKIHPRIKETAKRLWLIYFGLTVTVCFLYFMAGMNFFDSINHAFTTMSTGGYSTKNSSMAYFDSPLIEYIAIAFMFIGGINYTVIYFSLKGKLKRAWSSDELKTYLCFILTSILVIGLLLLYKDIYGVEQSFRTAAFQIISLVTTTGYITADYTTWGEVFSLIFFILLFTGACAGSTSGGIKIIRHLVFLKNSISEFKRILHPRALIRTRIDNYIVAPRILTHILVFLLIYLICFVMGSIFMAIMLEGQDQVMLSSIGSIASCLGNVGPAIGTVGPVDNYSHFPAAAKWLLSFYMILGRLELFSILIILTPFFWKVN
ncbi:UNVERIFIED_CONTAM: hypothetical protein GTU68_042136 [Idotea baltica]|nr:hypothetical protein [Idotea baltica]